MKILKSFHTLPMTWQFTCLILYKDTDQQNFKKLSLSILIIYHRMKKIQIAMLLLQITEGL